MDFCIHKSYFGTPFHLKCFDDGRTVKFYDINESKNMVMIGTEEAKTISKLYYFDIPRFPSKKYTNFFYNKARNVPWHFVMSKSEYQKETKAIISHFRSVFKNLNIEYYENCYKVHTNLFENLKPAKINSNKIVSLITDEKEDAILVNSFIPTNGYSQIPVYSRLDSRTGRLKTESGPMILNIKKKYRDVLLESRFENGELYQLDYSSLEPRILLALTDKTKTRNKDIYQDISDETDVPRNEIKKAALSRIYGSSANQIVNNLKDYTRYPGNVLDEIDDYFGFEKLKRSIKNEFNRNDGQFILNHYGRPIKCDDSQEYVLLNYFIQSTGVDVCLFGFNEIVKRLTAAEITDKIVPLFVLHDALYIDVAPNYVYLLDKICKAGSINIPKFEDIDFFLKPEQIV